MKTKIFIYGITLSTLIAGCNSNPKNNVGDETNNLPSTSQEKSMSKDISFSLAKNYFVKNTVKHLDDPKIETPEKFNEIFGMAATMNKDGKPTAIDFSKQFVIAVVKPETDLETTLTPVGIQKNQGNETVLTYKAIVGPKQSFTTRPIMIVIVDKPENGKVVLNELN